MEKSVLLIIGIALWLLQVHARSDQESPKNCKTMIIQIDKLCFAPYTIIILFTLHLVLHSHTTTWIISACLVGVLEVVA